MIFRDLLVLAAAVSIFAAAVQAKVSVVQSPPLKCIEVRFL